MAKIEIQTIYIIKRKKRTTSAISTTRNGLNVFTKEVGISNPVSISTPNENKIKHTNIKIEIPSTFKPFHAPPYILTLTFSDTFLLILTFLVLDKSNE